VERGRIAADCLRAKHRRVPLPADDRRGAIRRRERQRGARADRPRSAPRPNERPGARWPGADRWGSLRAPAWQSQRERGGQINLHGRRWLAREHGIRPSGREGARAIPTIPEARPRPMGGAPGSLRPARRAVGGAPEHRPFRVTPGGEHL
jgi:hypothetical protein